MTSIGFSSTATRLPPASAQALVSRSAPSTVCSHGENPSCAPCRQIVLYPGVRRLLDQMFDREQRAVDFLAHLHLITAVDEQRRAVGQHDGDTGRAGEAGEPGEPLVGGRNVFVQIAIGARHHKAAKPAAREFRAQRGEARRTCGAIGAIVERLELGFEHGAQSKAWPGKVDTGFRRDHVRSTRCGARGQRM